MGALPFELLDLLQLLLEDAAESSRLSYTNRFSSLSGLSRRPAPGKQGAQQRSN